MVMASMVARLKEVSSTGYSGQHRVILLANSSYLYARQIRRHHRCQSRSGVRGPERTQHCALHSLEQRQPRSRPGE
jgi:hypothetical protein